MPRRKISAFAEVQRRRKGSTSRWFNEKREQRVQVVMEPSLYAKTRAIARAWDISFSELVHAALECVVTEYIRDFGDGDPETVREQVLQSEGEGEIQRMVRLVKATNPKLSDADARILAVEILCDVYGVDIETD